MSPIREPSLTADSSAPVVSIVIPVYNVAAYLGEALASVRAQSFRHYEIIVINDGSPDAHELHQVLQPFRRHVVYLDQPNSGVAAARNAGIRAAQGEFIAFLDGDDVWRPEYLEMQMAAFQADPGLDLCYADAELIGDSPLAGRSFMETHPSRGEVTLRALLAEECVVMTSCVVVRRRPLFDAGLFDETLSHCEDFDLWVRLAYNGCRLAFQDRVLAGHRIHQKSLAANLLKLFETQVAVYRNFLTTLNLPDPVIRIVEVQLHKAYTRAELERGKRCLAVRDYEGALAAFEQAAIHGTSPKLRAAMLALRVAPDMLRRAYGMSQWLNTHCVRLVSLVNRRRARSGARYAA